MTRAKRKTRKFIRWLFAICDYPEIPVYIHWYHPAIATETGYGFGVFSYRMQGNSEPCIHVAGKKLGTSAVMRIIAHEYAHYLQWKQGYDMDDENNEDVAEIIADKLLKKYRERKK